MIGSVAGNGSREAHGENQGDLYAENAKLVSLHTPAKRTELKDAPEPLRACWMTAWLEWCPSGLYTSRHLCKTGGEYQEEPVNSMHCFPLGGRKHKRKFYAMGLF